MADLKDDFYNSDPGEDGQIHGLAPHDADDNAAAQRRIETLQRQWDEIHDACPGITTKGILAALRLVYGDDWPAAPAQWLETHKPEQELPSYD